MNGTTPTFLAFNFAAAEPHASRIVLLANLANHKFALKYYVPAQPDDNSTTPMTSPEVYAVATGIGGYDLSTGPANPGHYNVAFHDGTSTASLCVNNEGGLIEASAANCTDVPAAWTSSAELATALGASTLDATRVAEFLGKFDDANPLGPADAWSAVGQEDLYWPATLE
jgi:hypothetical protein